MAAAADNTPSITVVLLCYNHERFVEECLESVRAQTYQDFELIVMDDASTDKSAAVITRWLAEHRPDATFIQLPKNRGICAVLNIALGAARGKYFAMVSTDDTWASTKLEEQHRAIEARGADVGMVYSDAALMDVNGTPIPGNFIEREWPSLTPPSGNIVDILTTRNFIPAMATLIRTDALRAVGGYDETLVFEDYDMWLRLARRYQVVFLDLVLARYRIVQGSLIHTLITVRAAALAVSRCRIALKQLRNHQLTQSHRTLWMSRLIEESYFLYCRADGEAPRYLREAARVTRKPRWAMVATAASIGLTHARVQRIRRLLHQQ